MDANPTVNVLASSSAFLEAPAWCLATGAATTGVRRAGAHAERRSFAETFARGAMMEEADISSAFAFVQPERNVICNTSAEILLAE